MTTIKTLVTGATGFAGGHLLDRLAGTTSIVAWQRPGGSPAREVSGVEWRSVDLTDRTAVAREVAYAAPDMIFHLAGAPSVRTSWQNSLPHLRINVLGTHYLLEAVRLGGRPCRTLVVSSAQVYAASDTPTTEGSPLKPPSPYGLSKLAEEQLALRTCADDELDVVVARPFNHIGPRQSAEFAVASFARQIARIESGLAPPTLRVGNLAARRDVTDVRDVVDAYARLMSRGQTGQAYNICSGRAPLMQELLDGLCARSTATVHLETADDRMRPNDVPLVVGNPARIMAEAGWSPTIPLDQTLTEILDYWRAEVRAGR